MKLKQEVKVGLIIFFVLVVFGIILYLVDTMDKNFIKDCMSAGYSKNYCIENK